MEAKTTGDTQEQILAKLGALEELQRKQLEEQLEMKAELSQLRNTQQKEFQEQKEQRERTLYWWQKLPFVLWGSGKESQNGEDETTPPDAAQEVPHDEKKDTKRKRPSNIIALHGLTKYFASFPSDLQEFLQKEFGAGVAVEVVQYEHLGNKKPTLVLQCIATSSMRPAGWSPSTMTQLLDKHPGRVGVCLLWITSPKTVESWSLKDDHGNVGGKGLVVGFLFHPKNNVLCGVDDSAVNKHHLAMLANRLRNLQTC